MHAVHNYTVHTHVATLYYYTIRVCSTIVLQIWTLSEQYNDDETLLAMHNHK